MKFPAFSFHPGEGDRAFVLKYLALFLGAVLLIGLFSHYAAVGSDPYGVIHFAQHLSRGRFFSDYPVYGWFKTDWEPGKGYMVLYGNYQLRNGRMFCKYTIGYSLLLAASIRLFGPLSVYVFNVFVLVLLLLFQYLFAREALAGRPGRDLLALGAPALMLLLVSKIWDTAVKPVHDLPALACMVGGLMLGVRSLRRLPIISWGPLALGAFGLGFSGSMRLPNVLIAFPAGAYLALRLIGRVRIGRIGLILFVVALSFALGLLPVLIQNQLSTGHPLKPPRPEVMPKETINVEEGQGPPPLWLGFFKTTFPETAKYFGEIYGPLFLFLIAAGMVSGRRSPELICLGLGVPLTFILFYSCWVHLMTRYMMIAQPFLTLLAIAGAGALLAAKVPVRLRAFGLVPLAADLWFRARLRSPAGLTPADLLIAFAGAALFLVFAWGGKALIASRFRSLALALLLCALASLVPSLLGARSVFQVPDAVRFGRDFDRIVPESSLVLATKPMTQLIALFTSSHSVRPVDLPRLGVELPDAIRIAWQRGTAVYLLDNMGETGEGSAAKYIPILQNDFDLVPAGKLEGRNYHLSAKFGREVCTLYRIVPWSRREIVIPLAAPAGDGPGILTLNAGKIWENDPGRTRIDLEMNGRRLPATLRDGANFISVPREFIAGPIARLSVRSDRPLPERMEALLQSAWSDYVVNLGRGLAPDDRIFASGFFEHHFKDRYYKRLSPNHPAGVTIPLIALPDTVLWGAIRVKQAQKKPRNLALVLSLGGEEILRRDISRLAGWETYLFPLPAGPSGGTGPRLEVRADLPPGERFNHQEGELGALLVDWVRVKRFLKKAVLATPEPGHYYLAFTTLADPAAPGNGGIGAARVNSRDLAEVSAGDTVRLLLPPDLISPPETALEIVPRESSGGILIDQPPVLLRIPDRLTIAVGGGEDWVFLGAGFYPSERHQGTVAARWTAETAAIYLPRLPSGGGGERITFRLIPQRPAASLPPGAEARLFADGIDLGGVPLASGAASLAWTLPPSAEASVVPLSLVVPPWRPADSGNSSDGRSLGVMLERVEVEHVSK